LTQQVITPAIKYGKFSISPPELGLAYLIVGLIKACAFNPVF
jgi:hypothetical protein